MKSLLSRLKKSKLGRITALYIASGLGVIYAADVIVPALSLPSWIVTLVIMLVGLGLPLALVLIWSYDQLSWKSPAVNTGQNSVEPTVKPYSGQYDPMQSQFFPLKTCLILLRMSSSAME